MSKYINFPALEKIKVNVLKSICTPTPKQVWLVGPEGRGKTTFVTELLDHLHRKGTQSHISCYFDFKNVKNYNYQTVLVKFVDSVLSSASKLTHQNTSSLKGVFDDLKARFPKFGDHTSSFFKHLEQSNSLVLTNNKRWMEAVSSLSKGEMNFESWWKACSMTYELFPQSFGVSERKPLNGAQTLLMFVNSIACRVDMGEAQGISANSSAHLTGRWAVSYLIECMKSLSKRENINWIMCNDGVEHLVRSPFMNDRGRLFLSHLIFNLQLSKIPSVFISNDSASVILLTNKYYESVFNKDLNNPPESWVERNFDVNNFEFYDLPEMPQDLVMQFLTSRIPGSEKIIKAIWKITGGNLYLIDKILSDYREFDKRVSLGTVQQVLSGSSLAVDDEYFPINKSREEQLQYLREEQLKMFVKNLYHDTLNSEVIKFENAMNELLSNTSIEEMRAKVNNEVHFKVILFETIRHLLEKKWMRVKDGINIDNKIILNLISSNLMYYQIGSGMLEFKNSLVKYLLRSYIDIEYESMKPIEKVEYKANFLLNQRKLYEDLDQLFV